VIIRTIDSFNIVQNPLSIADLQSLNLTIAIFNNLLIRSMAMLTLLLLIVVLLIDLKACEPSCIIRSTTRSDSNLAIREGTC
jgi:hypothetical protein